MSFIRQLLGMAPAKGPNSASKTHSQLSPGTSPPSRSSATEAGTRRELLRVVLRNTLNRHGIPTAWIGAEMLLATSRGREPGIHWRLVVKHWDPRLMTHAVALQNALIVRVLAFDPLAASWLMGISWQFSLADESVCPPMPHPGIWTSETRGKEPAESDQAELDGGSGDVIAGPVRIADPAPQADPDADVKADLERLFAIRDEEIKLHSQRQAAGPAEATQPMYLNTEPLPLERQQDPSQRGS
jgi:hypothetical protein